MALPTDIQMANTYASVAMAYAAIADADARALAALASWRRGDEIANPDSTDPRSTYHLAGEAHKARAAAYAAAEAADYYADQGQPD